MIYGSRYPDLWASIAARQAQSEAQKASSEVEFLRHDVDRLLMIAEALWTILKEQHGYDDAELMRRVQEIDLRDGRMDGRVAQSEPIACEKCGRPIGKRRGFCIYCGTPVADRPFGS